MIIRRDLHFASCPAGCWEDDFTTSVARVLAACLDSAARRFNLLDGNQHAAASVPRSRAMTARVVQTRTPLQRAFGCKPADADPRCASDDVVVRLGHHVATSTSVERWEIEMGLMDILNQALAGGSASPQQFDQVAQSVPTGVVADGLAHAFRSDQTPEIGAMVGQMFGNSNGQQQAGMLNQIIASLGPAATGGLAGGILGRILGPGASQVTPDQASQLTPQQVQDVVQQAHQANPGIADQLAAFYAQHSGLIKTLGGAALAVAMVKMKDHVSQS